MQTSKSKAFRVVFLGTLYKTQYAIVQHECELANLKMMKQSVQCIE